ncbi:MAG: hypothetical protein IJV06_09995 [Bacteroidaceae bacterium]|nr:hypothetical protein [Bacteroidaceae bacterium]
MKRISYSMDNVGGLGRIVAIPAEVFNRLQPDFSKGTVRVSVSDEEMLVELPVFYNAAFVFTEQQELGDGGQLWNVEISGVIPRNDTDSGIRQRLERGQWLVMHRDRNGCVLLSGTKDVPLLFSSGRSSGGNAGMNGDAFRFSAQEPGPSVEVEDEIAVEE